MRELFEKTLDVNVDTMHRRLRDCVVEDTKDNIQDNRGRGVFMGKVGAKKFYVLFKPPYMNHVGYMTVMRGDISATEDGRTRLRYRFCKFRTSVVLASILLIAVTVLAVYAFSSNSFNFAGDFCILGFFLACVLLYLFSIVSSKEARDRLLDFVEALSKE